MSIQPTMLPSGWKIVGGYLFGPGADLSGDQLLGIYLQGVDLAAATLMDAVLISTNLSGADLAGADVTGANLSVVDLAGANLTSVVWAKTTCPDGSNSNSDGDTCANNLNP